MQRALSLNQTGLNLIEFSILPEQFLNFHLFYLKYFYTYFNELYAMYKILPRESIEMHTMKREKVCYEILFDYQSKLLQIKLTLLHIFHGLHNFNFL